MLQKLQVKAKHVAHLMQFFYRGRGEEQPIAKGIYAKDDIYP